MKTIQEIYEQYQIPRNLQRHMYRVASVGQYLAEQWPEAVAQEDIVSVLLLHDLGNILKFDFARGVELFDEDERDVDHWKQVQSEYRKTYGDSVHGATLAIAQQEGASDRVVELFTKMGSSNLKDAVESDDWELKICIYSDFRVSPHGFVTVTDRFDDILQRYAGRPHPLANQERTLQNRDACLELEGQLSEKIDRSIVELPEGELEQYTQSLASFCLNLDA